VVTTVVMSPGQIVTQISRTTYALGRAILAATVFFFTADHGSAHAESIVEAITKAYSANPRINAERARQRADLEKLPQAKAGLFATINGTADRGEDRARDSFIGTSGRGRNTGLGITLSQPLFDGFQTYNEIQRARAEITAGQETLDAVSLEVLLSVSEAYLDVIRDRKIAALRREAIAVFKAQLKQAEQRFTGGDLTRTGVDQARSRLLEAEGDFAQARADLAASEAFYRSVVGQDPGRLVLPILVKATFPQTLEMALRIAENQNSKLRASYHNFLAAGYAVSSARGALAPKVSLDANTHATRGLTAYRTEPNESSVRVKLSMQLFNGGRDVSRLSQAQEFKNQRQFEVDDVRATMRKIVESAWYAVEGAKKRLAASSGRIVAAQAALRGLLIEFEAGQTPIVYVLDGRREVITAQVARTVAERDHIYQHVVMMAALGQLGLDHFGPPPGVAQPDRRPSDQSAQSQTPPGRKEPQAKAPSSAQTISSR
jgi:outer membrane protein